MKIAVVGCGAIGSFYGARLCRAGHATHFLLRSDFEAVRQSGVHIKSVDGDFTIKPLCANRPEAVGIADLVLVSLKTTANHQLPRLLPPLAGPHTLVVTLQNGLGNEARLAEVLGPDNILGALCFVCLNRTAPGIIHHTAHGRIVLGEYQRPPLPRTLHLANEFKAAGIPCEVADDMERAHWIKLIWNIPFNGLGVAGAAGYPALAENAAVPSRNQLGPTLPTNLLLADARWEQLVRELMAEVIRIAQALGHAMPGELVEENLHRTRIMDAYKASTLLDFEKGLPLELDSLFLEPLRHARETGVAAPRLTRLCQVLQQIAPG